jgi:hypothetical protein
MRKRIITSDPHESVSSERDWLNIEGQAEVEITSEDAAHPIESALLPGVTSGWRAAGPGIQTIRLLFTTPQKLQRIELNFEETRIERTQEYVLRWLSDGEQSFQDIVRQQWNFNPQNSTYQTEVHHVNLSAVSVLELTIIPDTRGGNAVASLERLRIA